jgi:hypothetical protein
MNNEKGRQFLLDAFSEIKSFTIDSVSITNARKSKLLGKDGFNLYWIEYEYKLGNKFFYFTFGINDQNQKLTITGFNITKLDNSLSKTNAFTFQGKGLMHYMFFSMMILIPIFIVITVIVAIRTKIPKKWLWILGILTQPLGSSRSLFPFLH